jgi:glutamate--cysteine ligase
MNSLPAGRLSRDHLLGYILEGAVPRASWRVGMELEQMGRRTSDGGPLAYDGEGPTVRQVLDLIRMRRGGEPMLESDRIIGVRAPWGTITLEPGGQVEWSSVPHRNLAALEQAQDEHLCVMREAASALGVKWLEVAVEPVHGLADMPWMPKARYGIMREYFRTKGRLAHRMMTQTASIQCAFDFADAEDWTRKFRAAAILAPVATALFANSSHIDGRDTGYRCYRHEIWRQTDDDRCGLPAVVFSDGFDLERWVDWMLDVPLLFRRRDGELVPADGSTFRQVLEGPDGPNLDMDDWATHCSSIFTEVRSFGYMEVRSADLQPDGCALAVPTFWTGMLYDDDALGAVLDDGAGIEHAAWLEAMDSAARRGLDGVYGGRSLREIAVRLLATAARAFERGIPCSGDGAPVRHLESLSSRLALDIG